MKLILIICISLRLWSNDLDKGMDAYDNKDYKLAIKYWQPVAKKGNSLVQGYMAIMYSNGRGVDKNESEAFFWYKMSANLGNENSQFYVAMYYYLGRGVKKDVNQSIFWYKKAANQGNSRAQNNLGTLYIKNDEKEAISWWIKAARQENLHAFHSLSIFCQKYWDNTSCNEFKEIGHSFCKKNTNPEYYSVAHFCTRFVKLFPVEID